MTASVFRVAGRTGPDRLVERYRLTGLRSYGFRYGGSMETAGVIGMEIAREIVSAVGSEFPGIYLITLFLHFDSTCELAPFAREM